MWPLPATVECGGGVCTGARRRGSIEGQHDSRRQFGQRAVVEGWRVCQPMKKAGSGAGGQSICLSRRHQYQFQY